MAEEGIPEVYLEASAYALLIPEEDQKAFENSFRAPRLMDIFSENLEALNEKFPASQQAGFASWLATVMAENSFDAKAVAVHANVTADSVEALLSGGSAPAPIPDAIFKSLATEDDGHVQNVLRAERDARQWNNAQLAEATAVPLERVIEIIENNAPLKNVGEAERFAKGLGHAEEAELPFIGKLLAGEHDGWIIHTCAQIQNGKSPIDSIGKLLQAMLDEYELTAAELARRSTISDSDLNQQVNDSFRTMIGPVVIEKYADGFDLSGDARTAFVDTLVAFVQQQKAIGPEHVDAVLSKASSYHHFDTFMKDLRTAHVDTEIPTREMSIPHFAEVIAANEAVQESGISMSKSVLQRIETEGVIPNDRAVKIIAGAIAPEREQLFRDVAARNRVGKTVDEIIFSEAERFIDVVPPAPSFTAMIEERRQQKPFVERLDEIGEALGYTRAEITRELDIGRSDTYVSRAQKGRLTDENIETILKLFDLNDGQANRLRQDWQASKSQAQGAA